MTHDPATARAMLAETNGFTADEELLRAALGIPPHVAVAPLSREPLGSGSVAGFSVAVDGVAAPVVYYVDTSRTAVASETGAALVGDDGATEARVWLHPADPHLPALTPAAFGHAATMLLSRIGVHAEREPVLAGYRPGRRAVLRVGSGDGDVWIKVVRPSRISRIVELHGALTAAGIPVPAVRAWSPEGLVILPDAGGVAAIEADVDPEVLLDAVDRLRAAISGVPLEISARTALSRRVDWYSARIEESMPGAANGLSSTLRAYFAGERERPQESIHGDLHLGQIFMRDNGSSDIIGVIDVDTAGRGDPSEDSGAFISHAIASTLLSRGMPGHDRLRALAQRAHARWGADAAVRARCAAQLLGHAVAAADTGDRPRGALLLAIGEAVVDGAEDPFSAVEGESSDHKDVLTSRFERP